MPATTRPPSSTHLGTGLPVNRLSTPLKRISAKPMARNANVAMAMPNEAKAGARNCDTFTPERKSIVWLPTSADRIT